MGHNFAADELRCRAAGVGLQVCGLRDPVRGAGHTAC